MIIKAGNKDIPKSLQQIQEFKKEFQLENGHFYINLKILEMIQLLLILPLIIAYTRMAAIRNTGMINAK
ncbi:unnamed protein product [Paramecium sonneborni]|uniref:Uncharacterized protein n=1 Tax=Paramecium sonneborni TaxID=65129 RepID=A0A8S1NN43_9CILI|nr:unnamed protein product [Paramecium sonneborni]